MKRRTTTPTSPSPFRLAHTTGSAALSAHDLFMLRLQEEEDREAQRPTLEVVRPYNGTITDKGITLKWPVPFGREH